MKITAMRALLASKAAMEEAGYAAVGTVAVDGWLARNYANSLGYGLRRCEDATLEWNLRLDGEGHMRWRSYEQRQGDDTVELHEPEDDARLHAPIRRIFQGLGLDVAGVRTSGWGGSCLSLKWVGPVPSTHPEVPGAVDPPSQEHDPLLAARGHAVPDSGR